MPFTKTIAILKNILTILKMLSFTSQNHSQNLFFDILQSSLCSLHIASCYLSVTASSTSIPCNENLLENYIYFLCELQKIIPNLDSIILYNKVKFEQSFYWHQIFIQMCINSKQIKLVKLIVIPNTNNMVCYIRFTFSTLYLKKTFYIV